MMTQLAARAEQAVRARQRERVGELAERLRTMFGEGAVEVQEARVLVRGRGIVKRWLIDPSLRFLAGGFK
jgi:hypothetical protein